jgi:multiple sugar transport system substrate-binding protein
MHNKLRGIVAGAAVAAMALAGCSSGSSSKGGGGGGGGASDRGPITVVQGKDNSNTIPTLTQMWNKDHPNEKVTFKQQSDSADVQLQDDTQHFQAKDPGYDIVSMDVVWTAEFAAKGWITPLKGAFALDTTKLLPATVKAATYLGTLYGAPASSDGGMLYYRKDLVPTPPKTWDEMISDCSKKSGLVGIKGCYAGQYKNYEGLTVNVAEAINTAGGELVKSDGKTPAIPSPEAKKGLDFLVNGFKQGYIPKDAIGYQETEGLNAFISGQLLFHRNWPYAVAIANGAGSKIVGKFAYAPLPGITADKPGASSLGGHSWAMSAFSKHKGTALDFLKFAESDAYQKYILLQATNAPVVTALYNDPTLLAKAPYLPILLKSIQNAVPRPITPYYQGVTTAIEQNTFSALQGQKSTDSALSDMAKAITSATSGGG